MGLIYNGIWYVLEPAEQEDKHSFTLQGSTVPRVCSFSFEKVLDTWASLHTVFCTFTRILTTTGGTGTGTTGRASEVSVKPSFKPLLPFNTSPPTSNPFHLWTLSLQISFGPAPPSPSSNCSPAGLLGARRVEDPKSGEREEGRVGCSRTVLTALPPVPPKMSLFRSPSPISLLVKSWPPLGPPGIANKTRNFAPPHPAGHPPSEPPPFGPSPFGPSLFLCLGPHQSGPTLKSPFCPLPLPKSLCDFLWPESDWLESSGTQSIWPKSDWPNSDEPVVLSGIALLGHVRCQASWRTSLFMWGQMIQKNKLFRRQAAVEIRSEQRMKFSAQVAFASSQGTKFVSIVTSWCNRVFMLDGPRALA